MTLRPLCTLPAWLIAALLLAAPPAGAQTGIPSVDSAAAARAAWRTAVRAQRAGDHEQAWLGVNRASAAWPIQPAYWAGVAEIAAQRRDTAALAAALGRLADIGSGPEAADDPSVRALASAPAVAAALARLSAATAPWPRSTVHRTLLDTTVYAEGIAADPRTGALFVSSIRHRTVYEVRPDGTVRDLGLRGAGVGAVFGVRLDPDGASLWITTAGLPAMVDYRPADSALAEVLRVRVRDGAVLRRWSLPYGATGHILGDLAIGPRGDVFVTDSRGPFLFRLRPGADTLEQLTHPLFRSLQGVAPTPEGRVLFLADYAHGLLRLDLATGEVDRLEDAPGASSLGLDGIALDGGAIIAIQNGVTPGRVVRLALDADGRRVTGVAVLDRNLPLADEPTNGVVLDGSFLYVANSQWNKYGRDGARLAGTRLAPTVILRLPLGGR